ncbi:sugar phosphate isomerase/epimerase family protein [Verrucomicrobiota bacterium sgz303538]
MIKTLCSSILLAGLMALAPAYGTEPIPDSAKTGGFGIGCQAYTFNRFSLFEAIEKTAETGAKVIELFPGQKLSKDEPNVKVDHNSPADVIDKVKAKLKQHNLIAVAYGVVGIPKDEAGARKVFDFAKKMGIRVINTESTDAIDTIDKLVKEYDLKVGYHNHPSRPNDPNYKVWDPNYIAALVKDHDQRIGACADTGHWVRSGLKPVECIEILKGRIVSSHLKDLHEAGRGGHDLPYGTGISDVKGILDAYKAQNFDGPISIEYEYKWENNVPEAKQCIDFVRAYGEKKG